MLLWSGLHGLSTSMNFGVDRDELEREFVDDVNVRALKVADHQADQAGEQGRARAVGPEVMAEGVPGPPCRLRRAACPR